MDAFCCSAEFQGRQWDFPVDREGGQAEYYYFFHIPKTAGLTVKAYLAQSIDPAGPPLFSGVFVKDLIKQMAVIQQCAFFSGHFMGFLDPLLGKTTRKATLLRDPVDRAISHYFHSIRDPSLPLHNMIKGRSPADILKDETTRGFAVNYHAKYLATLVDDAHWLEHTLLFRESSGSDEELLEKARAGLALMDVVGIHEDLSTFFRRLAEQWPIHHTNNIPKENVGGNRHNQQFNDSARQTLRELNAVDYAIYREVVDKSCSEKG